MGCSSPSSRRCPCLHLFVPAKAKDVVTTPSLFAHRIVRVLPYPPKRLEWAVLWRKDVWERKSGGPSQFDGHAASAASPHQPAGSHLAPVSRHTYRLTTMSYQNRDVSASAKIYTLFFALDLKTYDEVAQKLEYWIETVLSQRFTTVAKLVEYVSTIAWTTHKSPASLARFLKEFRDSPRRSAHARSFVDELCTRVFLWFTAASEEDLAMDWYDRNVAKGGGCGFREAASFVGNFIQRDLLNHKLVRQHLIKSLITHYYPSPGTQQEIVRINAIFQVFVVAGDVLVQGLLEPDDARACFEILETRSPMCGLAVPLSTAKLEVQCVIHPDIPIGS